MNQENGKNPNFSPRQMQKVMSSAEGKELLALLSESGKLREAMEAFKRGDMKGVQAALGPVMESEKASELMEKIHNRK